MANKSVTPEPARPKIELANDDHWINLGWDDNPLPQYVKQRLSRADRCIVGAASLTRLLRRFAIGMADVEETGDGEDYRVLYPALDKVEADQLGIALQELLDVAEGNMEEIRCNLQGYVDSALREKARG